MCLKVSEFVSLPVEQTIISVVNSTLAYDIYFISTLVCECECVCVGFLFRAREFRLDCNFCGFSLVSFSVHVVDLSCVSCVAPWMSLDECGR